MAQRKRKDDWKIQRLNIGGGGIGGLIVLGGVVAGAALLGMLKRRNDGKRSSCRDFSGQRLPKEVGKEVAQVGFLSAIGDPIFEENQPGKSLGIGDAIDENSRGGVLIELMSKNKERTDNEVEISLESRQNYPREFDPAENNNEIADKEVEISLESRQVHQRELDLGEKNLLEENLADQCEVNEEHIEDNVEIEKKEMQDEKNGICVDLPVDKGDENDVDDMVDNYSMGITEEPMQEECSIGKLQVDFSGYDPVVKDLICLVLEKPAIQDKDEVVEQGGDSNSLVLEKPSIQAKENAVELGEHISSSSQDVAHLNHVQEEEIEYKLSADVINGSIDLLMLSIEKDHFSSPVQDNEKLGRVLQRTYEEQNSDESSSKVECSSFKLVTEIEEENILNQKVHTSSENDHFSSPVQDNEKLGRVLQRTYEEQNSDESSRKVECSSFKLVTEIEEENILNQKVHTSSETFAAEGKYVHLSGDINNQSSETRMEKSDGSLYGIENLHLISEITEEENGSLYGQQSLSLDHSSGETDEQCLDETKDSPTDTEDPIEPLNLAQFNESEQCESDPNNKMADDIEVNFQHDQAQEHNVSNEQQEARNAYLNGDKQIKMEEEKIAYEAYERKDERFFELMMNRNKSISMVRSILVGLLLILLYHIFAKF